MGAYIRLRGNTDCRKAFIVDPEGDECIIVDTGAGISCCGPDCKFFDDPSDPPVSLRLMGANSSPLQVLKFGKFRLVFGHPCCQTIGISFVALDYAEPLAAPSLEFSGVLMVTRTDVPRSQVTASPAIQGTRGLHSRFGIVDPVVFDRLHEVANGVERVGRRARDRFITSAYVRAAQQRSRVSSICGASHREPAAPGMRASLDLTRRFSPDLDGYTCAALFLDEKTHYLWEGPMEDHTGKEFVRVFEDY